jgi:hypothetical protein
VFGNAPDEVSPGCGCHEYGAAMAARAALVASALLSFWVGTASASSGVHRFVALQGTNGPSCELASHVPGLGTFVYCLIGPRHALSVEMRADGVLHVCRGARCMSNSPMDVRVLDYGTSVSVGPFRCIAKRAGMRCIVTRLGHGFFLSRTSLTRI